MPKVDMIATKDFTYMTRRLTAGDPFQARNGLEARILERVRRTAEYPKSRRKLEPAPVETTEATSATSVEQPAPKRRKRKAKAKK
jgi:hypothetical protein